MIANGRFMEAVGWAKETSSYCEKKFGVPKVEVWVDAFGPIGRMRWSTDFNDLAALESVQLQMLADPGYWQLIDKAFKNGLFVDGTGDDVVSRSL
jgi:hypothetical protein